MRASPQLRLVPPRRETKAVATVTKPIECKLYSLHELKITGDGTFEGYLAVFSNEDLNGDVIEHGAFTKTLREAREVKARNKSPFLFPLLFMHDENLPIGGFTDMQEDNHGLYVKGRCDLNIERGRWAFSGMQMGYMAQMSIGYDTVKSTRDTKTGARHLLEVRLWEGSAVTTGYAANGQALITETKSKALAAGRPHRKTATGKSSWPLGERDAAWDSGEAHKRIVAWATNSDDTLDTDKMKSVHFWTDDSDDTKIGSYKLLFCDVVNGSIKAMPKGIFACTGAHGVDAVKGISSSDVSAIKDKISAYYARMRKEFDDDSLVPSWEQEKVAWRRAVQKKQQSGLQCLMSCLSGINYYYSNIDTMMDMLGDATDLDLDPDEGDEGVAEQLSGGGEAGGVQQAVQTLLDNMPGLKEALVAMGKASQDFDDAMNGVLDMFGMSDISRNGGYDYGYMTASPILELKTGRELSQANVDRLKSVSDGLASHKKTIDDMIDGTGLRSGVAGNDEGIVSGSKTAGDHGAGGQEHKTAEQPEHSATTAAKDNEPAADDDATLTEALADVMLSMNITAARYSVQ